MTDDKTIQLSFSVRPIHAGTRPATSPGGSCRDGI